MMSMVNATCHLTAAAWMLSRSCSIHSLVISEWNWILCNHPKISPLLTLQCKGHPWSYGRLSLHHVTGSWGWDIWLQQLEPLALQKVRLQHRRVSFWYPIDFNFTRPLNSKCGKMPPWYQRRSFLSHVETSALWPRFGPSLRWTLEPKLGNKFLPSSCHFNALSSLTFIIITLSMVEDDLIGQ